MPKITVPAPFTHTQHWHMYLPHSELPPTAFTEIVNDPARLFLFTTEDQITPPSNCLDDFYEKLAKKHKDELAACRRKAADLEQAVHTRYQKFLAIEG